MIKTKLFSLSRTELARIASEEYIRTFWWLVAPVPVMGIIAVITARGPLQVLGMLAILWPFSIPARSVLSTTKSSRLFTGGCHVEASADQIEFIGEYNKEGKRLRYAFSTDKVKEAVRRRGIIILRMRLPGISPIREDAFESESEAQAFLNMIEEAVAKRLEEEGG